MAREDWNAKEARPGGPVLAAGLLNAFRWFETALLARLHARGWTGLRAPHSMLFAHLDLDGGTRPSELARRIGVSRQAVHLTVNDLRNMGLVELEPDPENSSAKRVVLTQRGHANVDDARRIFAELERELERRIGKEDVAALRSALRRDWGLPPKEGGLEVESPTA